MCSRLLFAATLVFVWPLASADTENFKDPMRPLGPGRPESGPVEQRFELTATLISEGRRVAVLNGRPTRAGEVVDGAVVVAVESSSVELRVGSRSFTVSLGGRPARQPRTEGEPES